MSIEVMELYNIFAETFGKEKAQIAVRDIEVLISNNKEDLAKKTDILEVKGDIREVELKLTREIEQAKSSTIKWMVGLLMAQTGAIIAIITLLK